MAKQIVAWCDIHMEQGQQVAASSLRLSLDESPPREIDLCEEHITELIEPLRNLLEEAGQPVTTPEKAARKPRTAADPLAPKPYRCTQCAMETASRDSLGKHLRKKHNVSMHDVKEVDIVNPDMPGGEYACTECPRTFDRPQGIAIHLSKIHGIIRAAKQDDQQAALAV